VWVLYVPTFVSYAMLAKSRTHTIALAVVTTLIHAGGFYLDARPFADLVVPLSTLYFSAFFGIALAAYQVREQNLSARDRRLTSVLAVGGSLGDIADLRQMMLQTLKTAVQETRATCGYIMLMDDDDKVELVTEVAYAQDGEFDFPEKIEVGAGLSGYVAKMAQPITLAVENDVNEDFDGLNTGVRSAASVPLISRRYQRADQAPGEQVLGVMTLLDTQNSTAFEDADMELIRTLSSLVAVSVTNARMEERRRATFLRTLESLATALEARDEYTRGHSQRVCEMSIMIGERMGLGLDALEELRVGTILHDIGKIGVPDAILNKRARLTDEEFLIMKSHPVIGYEICRPLMLSEGVLMIIRNHHEKLDGSGYPDGLKGGELPLSLRIVCVADAFDAMSSRRPYRGVMEMGTVLAELSKGAGTQFDPVVVEVLKELLSSERVNQLYKQYWTVTPEEQEQAA
jgi:putative nucleotidyltransferase with HDIG domain